MPVPAGDPDPPRGDEPRLEEERARREAEELENFERRADWWSLHYGGSADEAGERTQEAVEHAERMPRAGEPGEEPDGRDGA